MKVLALDIGGTKIAAAAVNTAGQFLKEAKIPTNTASWPEAKSQIVEMSRSFLSEHPDIKALGISSAGPLHATSGRLLNPTNINWGEVELTKELEKELKIPVLLENDAASAVLGEHWMGEFKNSAALVMLTLGTGLGVGVMIDHQLSRGGRGYHPEGGHMMLSVDDPTALCGCGNYGCGEAYLAGSFFLKRARAAYADPSLTPETFMEKARAKDPKAIELFENYSLRLAQFMNNYIVLAYPHAVILGGSFAQTAEYFLPQTYYHLERFLIKRPKDWIPRISVSRLQNAGILGAAKLAFMQLDPNSRSK